MTREEMMKSPPAAHYLGVTDNTLRKWRMQGVGPAYVRLHGKRGRIFYRRSDLDAWLDSRTFSSTAEETEARRKNGLGIKRE